MLQPLPTGCQRAHTSHALLCAVGQFAQACGLIAAVRRHLNIPMKTVDHTPADKLLTFFLYLLAGLTALPEADHGHHPLRKDRLLAQAWDQEELADHTGISLLLHRLTEANVTELRHALAQVAAPFIAQDLALARASGSLTLLLDLTGEPVSDQSQTYPQTEYGYMDGQLAKGYQLAVVSLCGPTRRTFLAGFHHPGSTVSSPCLRQLIEASETCLGRPRRRPDLVTLRIEALQALYERARRLAAEQAQQRQAAETRATRCQQRLSATQAEWQQQQAQQDANPSLTPSWRLSRLRQQRQGWQAMRQRAERQGVEAQRVMTQHQATAEALDQQIRVLQTYQQLLIEDNTTLPAALAIRVVIDAGFGTAENLTWLIEQGYEIDGKPHAPTVAPALRRQLGHDPQVQLNATTWISEVAAYQMAGCPYPLRWALCSQKRRTRLRYEALLSYRVGHRPTLRDWFEAYHQRADIEAGFKQSKGLFGLGTFHTRSLAGIEVQELWVLFACNFMAWFKVWLTQRPSNTFWATKGIQELVRIASHAEASVIINHAGWLICFDPSGPYPNRHLYVSRLPVQSLPTVFP